MVKKSKNGSTSVAPPPPPFLAKCYEMVDDQSTDTVISWTDSGESFVIWDVTVFSRDLLPKFYKHSNFSSFMRQLNIYGFRKMGFDRWEFYNEQFLKGQKHLLGTIKRRKHPHNSSSQQKIIPPPIPEEHHPVEQSSEKGRQNSTLAKEVETLKSDKKTLMQELGQLRELQEKSQDKLILLKDRLQGMEKSQQQLLSFLAMVIQNPGPLVQLLQSKEGNWRVAESGKITIREDNSNSDSSTSGVAMDEDGMMIRYQPLEDGSVTTTPMIASTPEADNRIKQDSSSLSVDQAAENNKDFFMNLDFSSFPLDENFLLSEQPRAPIILPELDLRAFEQFLLSSPGRDDAMFDGEGDDDIFDSEMDLESLICGTEMELPPENLHAEEEYQEEDENNSPEDLEFLTDQMELLVQKFA